MPKLRTRLALALPLAIGGGGSATLLAQVVLRATIGPLGTGEWLLRNIWPWITVPVGLSLGIGFLVFFAEPAKGQMPDLASADEQSEEQADCPLVQLVPVPILTALEDAALTVRQQHVALAIIAGMQAASGTREDTRRAREQEQEDSGQLLLPPLRHCADDCASPRGCALFSRRIGMRFSMPWSRGPPTAP